MTKTNEPAPISWEEARRVAIHAASKAAYEAIKDTCWSEAASKEVLSFLPQGQRSNYGLSSYSMIGGAEQPSVCDGCGKPVYRSKYGYSHCDTTLNVDCDARPKAPAVPAPPVLSPRLKIVTSYINPPIPTRNFDWAAWFDGHEEDGPYGHGPTEEAAINDLEANCE